MSIMIVQFLHTSGEHSISQRQMKAGNFTKDWNCGGHLRKYLHAKGAYIENGKIIGNEDKWEDIYFWGEWEPQSKVTHIENQKQGAFPHYIHEPFVEINESEQLVIPKPIIKKEEDGSLKKFIPTNTDPFVFGEDGFYYSCCMQNRKYKDEIKPTRLQKLEPGSIILFGSNINHYKKSDSNINQEKEPKPYFALDTVFVVGDDINEKKPYKQSYTIESYAEKLKKVPNHYLDIMNFKGWKESLKSTSNGIKLSDCNGSNCTSNKSESKGCEKGTTFTCYRGASYDNPIKCGDDKMYSFVPCKIGPDGEKGFERVKLTEEAFKNISKKAIISYNQCQGVNYTETNNIQENVEFWKKLRDYIKDEGYYEAVELKYTENKV